MTTPQVLVRKPLMCALHVHHVWRIASTEDGVRFHRCARCGKEKDPSRNGSYGAGWNGM